MDDPPSLTSSIFLQNAEELVERLGRHTSDDAKMMMVQAQLLADVFRGWQTTRPADDVRVACIDRLLELHRRAMEYLAKHGSSSATPPARR